MSATLKESLLTGMRQISMLERQFLADIKNLRRDIEEVRRLAVMPTNTEPEEPTIDIELVLQNWARWSRTKRGPGHCGSIEHMYRPPNHWHPQPANPPIEIWSALDVERKMQKIPRQHREALVWHYVKLAPARFICRRLALRFMAWEPFLHDAVCMIFNRLDRHRHKWAERT